MTKMTLTERGSMMAGIRAIDAQCAQRGLAQLFDGQALLLLQAADQGEGRNFDEAHDMLNELEARVGLDVSLTRAALGPQYLQVPGFVEWSTGGGCTALGKTLGDGHYILITDAEGGERASGNAKTVGLGVYDAEGCPEGDAEEIGVEDIPGYVEAAAVKYKRPPAETDEPLREALQGIEALTRYASGTNPDQQRLAKVCQIARAGLNRPPSET